MHSARTISKIAEIGAPFTVGQDRTYEAPQPMPCSVAEAAGLYRVQPSSKNASHFIHTLRIEGSLNSNASVGSLRVCPASGALILTHAAGILCVTVEGRVASMVLP